MIIRFLKLIIFLTIFGPKAKNETLEKQNLQFIHVYSKRITNNRATPN